jgi:MerR family transcriptional regulator, light-induced transcriptional regulator
MNNIIRNTPVPVHHHFLSTLLSGDRSSCSGIAHEYAGQHSVSDLYENLFKQSLYDIGKLWERNKISVATEHMASSIVEAILNEFYEDILSDEPNNRKVIVACVENEYHQIGIKMVSDVFEMNGWQTHFLGANTPTHDLIVYAKTISPDLIAISLSIYFNLPTLDTMIQTIRRELGGGVPLLIGGQAFAHGGKEMLQNYDNVKYKHDLKETDHYIKIFNNHG